MKKTLIILAVLLAALTLQTAALADSTAPAPAAPQEEQEEAVQLDDSNRDEQGIKYNLNSNDRTATILIGQKPEGTDIVIPSKVKDSVGTVYSVTEIGSYAFDSCSSLQSITIPDSVTSIGDFAFSECSGLTSVDIPDGVTSIGNRAFSECSSLTSVDIPDGVTSIGKSAFAVCRSLISVDIPDSVTSIGNGAFSYCTDLTSVTIPGSVTSIGDEAFRACDSLKSITFEGTVPEYWGDSPFHGCFAVQTVYLSDDLTEEERAEWESALKTMIPEGYTIEYKNLTPDPEPTPTPDPTPTTPPADTNTAAEPASAPTVQQMESAERPDPQDVEATERYNFWMGVKADLRAAADGKTLRVHVPADYTNMPASVMEQIRLLDADVTVDLRWNGERLTITPATAQRKTALKAFWTFAQLCEVYAQ